LADGIPGARRIHRPTAGHTLLHEIPQVVTAAISSAIAASSPVLAAGSQVSRLAQSDAVARVVDYGHSGAYDPGASAASEKPLGDDFRVVHCDLAFKASPVEVEERVS